jgi:hypothetical protein
MTQLWLTGELKVDHVLHVYEVRRELEELVIDSPGGDIQLAIAIIECLPKSVHTVALSICQSAAVYIFAAGSKRTCLPSTQFLMHAGTQSIECDAATFEQFRRHGKKVEQKLSSLLPEPIRAWDQGSDIVFDGGIARKHGLATGFVQTKFRKPKKRVDQPKP